MSRTARAVAGVVLIGVAIGIATGWAWSAEATVDAEVSERITAVELDNDSGNVIVRAGDVTATQIKQRFDYRFSEPDDAFEVDDGTLKLKDCGWWCSVDYEVVVPRDTKVSGEMESGNLTLIGLAAADVKADSGDIKLENIAGPVTLDIDSGNVEGTGLRGDLTVNADSGRLDLTFAEPVNVKADIDSGDVELTLPDVEYQVDVEIDSGTQDVEVDQGTGADHVLEFVIDSGDLTVRNG